MRLELQQIIDSVGAVEEVPAADPQVMISDFTWDSREVTQGSLFIALPGERVNGNDFILSALTAQAAAVIATRPVTEDERDSAQAAGAALLVVPDGLQALSSLAAGYRDLLSATVIGVTGSSGKTTTKELIAAVLSEELAVVATSGNHNNEYGVPHTVLSANPSTEALVVEMAMRGLGQIEALCAITHPDIGVVSNIGVAHLELLGSQENIARAKSEMISALPEDGGIAILNGDDPFTVLIRETAETTRRGVSVFLYGLAEHNDVRATAIRYNQQGQARFELIMPGKEPVLVQLALQGEHNIYNALAAAAVGMVMDIDLAAIAHGLAVVKGAAMRQETMVTENGTKVINDAYNANPDSMRAALNLLGRLTDANERIAVLGDMAELGEGELDCHHRIGRLVFDNSVDVLITVGQRALSIAEGAVEAGMDKDAIIVCKDVDEAIAALWPHLGNQPTILVKGSRCMGLERVVEGVIELC